jgi:hypothetical protein
MLVIMCVCLCVFYNGSKASNRARQVEVQLMALVKYKGCIIYIQPWTYFMNTSIL